jgi:hypothetical protein
MNHLMPVVLAPLRLTTASVAIPLDSVLSLP